MSGVYFVSDLHLGHRSILRHTREVAAGVDALERDLGGAGPGHPALPRPYRGGDTINEHDDWVIECLLSVNPDKRTLWYMLGDAAMDEAALSRLDEVPGRKRLVLGNHDLFPTKSYLRHFEQVLGGFKRYGFWITHMPLHPDELRGRQNLHGHCHHNTLWEDVRYFNACVEWLPGNRPVSLDWLRANWLKEGM